jgi:hypothetical protein
VSSLPATSGGGSSTGSAVRLARIRSACYRIDRSGALTYALLFFSDEERLLVKFFGQEYIDYRAKVVSGLPLVR